MTKQMPIRVSQAMKSNFMNGTKRNLIGLAASLVLAASASATTVTLNPEDYSLGGSISFTATNGNPLCADPTSASDVTCGTLPRSHGGQTVGWGYSITNNTGYYYWATGVSAVDVFTPEMVPHNFTYADASDPHGSSVLYNDPQYLQHAVIAPGASVYVPYVYAPAGSTGLFEIQWNTGLTNVKHEAGFFVLSGFFFNGDPFNSNPTFSGLAPDMATPFDASAPEPMSLVLLGTAFGIAFLGKRKKMA